MAFTDGFETVSPAWKDEHVCAYTVVAHPEYGQLDFSGNSPDFARNEQLLKKEIGVDNITWPKQNHSSNVLRIPTHSNDGDFDAVITKTKGEVCAIKTADCVPLVVRTTDGSQLAVIHAGWRGLTGNVIENTLSYFPDKKELLVWLGPAIAPENYKVGRDVYILIKDSYKGVGAFKRASLTKQYLDQYTVARTILTNYGVLTENISGGEYDTYEDTRFHSHRRDTDSSGRMATIAWIE